MSTDRQPGYDPESGIVSDSRWYLRLGEPTDKSRDSARASKKAKKLKVHDKNRRRDLGVGTGIVNIGSNYNDEEIEFLKAVDEYKRTHNARFLSNTEILQIIHSLGYRKVKPDASTKDQSNEPTSTGDKPQ